MSKGTRMILKGTVISNKMVNTVRVEVEYSKPHPKYKKIVKMRKVYFAHTDKELQIGDVVEIMESKPYSKLVKWVVI